LPISHEREIFILGHDRHLFRFRKLPDIAIIARFHANILNVQAIKPIVRQLARKGCR